MKTSIYTILCTVIRLGAVWFAMSVLLQFPGIYRVATTAEFGDRIGVLVVGFSAVAIFFAFLLWLYPGLFARLAASKSTTQVFESPISAEQLQQTGLAVLGMWFVMIGLVDLTHDVFRTLLVVQFDGDGAAISESKRLQIVSLLTDGARIALGGALVLGSHGLVGVVRRFRYAGMPVDQEIESQKESD